MMNPTSFYFLAKDDQKIHDLIAVMICRSEPGVNLRRLSVYITHKPNLPAFLLVNGLVDAEKVDPDDYGDDPERDHSIVKVFSHVDGRTVN